MVVEPTSRRQRRRNLARTLSRSTASGAHRTALESFLTISQSVPQALRVFSQDAKKSPTVSARLGSTAGGCGHLELSHSPAEGTVTGLASYSTLRSSSKIPPAACPSHARLLKARNPESGAVDILAQSRRPYAEVLVARIVLPAHRPVTDESSVDRRLGDVSATRQQSQHRLGVPQRAT